MGSWRTSKSARLRNICSNMVLYICEASETVSDSESCETYGGPWVHLHLSLENVWMGRRPCHEHDDFCFKSPVRRPTLSAQQNLRDAAVVLSFRVQQEVAEDTYGQPWQRCRLMTGNEGLSPFLTSRLT
jgi:hypothetical protein